MSEEWTDKPTEDPAGLVSALGSKISEMEARIEELEEENQRLQEATDRLLDFAVWVAAEATAENEKIKQQALTALDQEGALDRAGCDHEWVIESTQTRASASPSQHHDPSPEYKQADVVCKHCGVSRGDVK